MMTYSYIQLWERKLYVIHTNDYPENQVENTQGRYTSSSRRWKKKGLKELCSWKNK
jgi:hypothetical protein